MRHLGLLLLAVALLAACGAPTPASSPRPAPGPSETPPRTPLPTPISLTFPAGVFYHKHEATYCIYRFDEDGTWAFYWKVPTLAVPNTQPYLDGTYVTEGNLYTETSIRRQECAPGTYAWTFDGRTLAFQVVGEDRCGDRQQTLESPLLWIRLE